MRFSFKTRVLLVIAVSCTICTAAAVFVASQMIKNNGERALVTKSQAILSRLEVGREYIADMGTLKGVIEETVKRYPDGKISEEQKMKVLKSVPIFASMKLGSVGAEREHYQFRIFADNPRNAANKATETEMGYLRKFAQNPKLEEIVEDSADGDFTLVVRPVRLSHAQGCMTCHGEPSTSPWKNGKDVLGYALENMRDGDLKGAFAVISSKAPVRAETMASTRNIMMWGAILTALALAMGVWLLSGPLKHLNGIGAGLRSTGDQLGQASSSVSNVSLKISSGAEESAASLEELSSIVKRNAESSQEAASAAGGCLQTAERGEREMKDLAGAMTEITSSSKKIEEIITVIDDIAFQTNLLALNAAVEAARAGEQGRGFAVVAEAVRGLAQKSGEAARQVAELIRESVGSVERGSSLADSSAKALTEILHAVRKVAAQNDEIASASKEQAQGIEQISVAMNQLDRSSQENASASQQAAASSVQLQQQSEELQRLVQSLEAVMTGAELEPDSNSGYASYSSQSDDGARSAKRAA